jgi:hypothetical protein
MSEKRLKNQQNNIQNSVQTTQMNASGKKHKPNKELWPAYGKAC